MSTAARVDAPVCQAVAHGGRILQQRFCSVKMADSWLAVFQDRVFARRRWIMGVVPMIANVSHESELGASVYLWLDWILMLAWDVGC
jgi:hypothetical protein